MIGYGFTEDRPAPPRVPLHLPPADVVNLHWCGGAFDLSELLARAGARGPVVWTMHDMNGFTGGCHFDAGCARFINRCGACPQLASTEPEDRSRAVWKRKRAALAGVRDGGLTVVAPSRSFAGEVGRSSLLRDVPTRSIRYAVDTDVFQPGDRTAARAALGLPADVPVVGFVADSLLTRRKGFSLLDAALSRLRGGPAPLLLSVGANSPPLSAPVRRLHLDFVAGDARLAELYAAMDVLVVSSLQESMGFTALEAMACERPVVAFDAGPLPEMVVPGETGELAAFGDPQSLAEAIERVLADPQRAAELGRRGRAKVLAECDHEAQAARYVELYRAMLDG